MIRCKAAPSASKNNQTVSNNVDHFNANPSTWDEILLSYMVLLRNIINDGSLQRAFPHVPSVATQF